MKYLITRHFFILILIFASQNLIYGNTSSLSPPQWLEDLEQLEELILSKHAKPFWLANQKDFETLLTKAKKDIQQKNLKDEERLVILLKVIASIHDGHSSMRGSDRYESFGYLPFTAAFFDKELYITRADESYRKALGCKILKVGSTPIEQVLEKMKQVIPHANQSRFKKFLPYYLHLPGLLYGLGITKQSNYASLQLEDRSKNQFELKFKNYPDDSEDMVDFDWDLSPTPLYKKHSDKDYWFEYLKEESLLYLKYDRVSSMEKENIWAFSNRLFEFVDQNPIDKFVVDIRDNGGGNGAFSTSLWHGIVNNSKINQQGKLFVITGYKTFSAAIAFASYLELRSKAIFVGEGVCDYLRSPGDAEDFKLNHSGIKIGLSSLFHEKSFYEDERSTLSPDHEIILSFDDFQRGKDPVLNFIKSYNTSPPKSAIENVNSFIGSYQFSPYQRLDILKEREGLKIEIQGKMVSPLYPDGKNQFTCEVKGLIFNFAESGNLKIQYPDGKVRNLKKLNQAIPTLIDFAYAQNFKAFEEGLLKLKESHPEIQFWRDHSLSSLAIEAYYDFKSKGRDTAKAIARSILQAAINVNPNNHEFASASLEYY